MAEIRVTQHAETATGWQFKVTVRETDSQTTHTVDLPRVYWHELTGGTAPTEQLVSRSFEFLLEREPKESILRSFALPVIQQYFPDYEQQIRQHYNQPLGEI